MKKFKLLKRDENDLDINDEAEYENDVLLSDRFSKY